MGKFKQSLITTAGKSILLGGEVTYTTAKLFSQDVSSMTDDQVRALTALTGQLMSVGVSVEVMDNSTVSVKAVFSNKGLTADLTFSSVGWFAKAGSGTETLIAVTPIEGTKLLCAGLPNSSTDAINIAMNMAIGDSTTVNVVIDPAGTVSPVDLGSAISKIQTDVDTKATKADVDKEITTLTADKANSADVYTKSDVNNALAADRGRLGKLEGVQTVDSPDFDSITNTGVYYITNNTSANIKNNPVSQWGVLVVSSGNGQRISQVYYPDDDSPQWCRLLNGSNWLPWYQVSTKKDVSNATDLANQAQTTANTKANASDVYTKPEVDSKTSGNVVTAYDVASKSPTTKKTSYTSEELVDQGAFDQFADQINQLKGRQTVDAPDFNTLTDSGVYYITDPNNGKNFPSTIWGTLAVLNSNDARIVQIYFAAYGMDAFVRAYGGGNSTTWTSWNQIAWTSDITNLQNAVNSKVNVDGALYKDLTQFDHWSDLLDGYSVSGTNATNGSRLVAFRDDTNGGNTVGSNGAGIAFGGGDTKGVLSVNYSNRQARIAGGNGDKPVWHEDIAWKSDITNLQNTVAGVQTQVNNSAVGTNLLTGTSSALQTAPDSTSSTTGGVIHNFSSDELSILTSNQVTARVFIHNTTTHNVNLVLWTNNGAFGVGTSVPAGTDGYSTVIAYNAASSNVGDISIRAYKENTAISGVQYKELKLELGSHATDWSLNPSEISTKSDATNLQSMITGLSTKVDSAVTKLQNQITEIQSKNYIEGYNCANESDAETYSKAHPNTLVTVS